MIELCGNVAKREEVIDMKTSLRIKVSTKIAAAIAVVLVIVFAILILLSVTVTTNIVENSVSNEFRITAAANASGIQNTLSGASNVNTDIMDYAAYNYQKFAEDVELGLVDPSIKEASLVHDVEIDLPASDAEKYFLNTFWSSVGTNTDLNAMSIMFKPYSFDNQVETYALYVDKDTAAAHSYDAKLDVNYFEEDYYKVPMETKEKYITEPIVFEGQHVVTVADPLMHGEEVVGVVAADVNLESLQALAINLEHYESMYATVINHNGNYILNTRDERAFGTSYINTITNEKELERFQENLAKGEYFEQEIGDKTVFMTPIVMGDDTWWVENGLDTSELHSEVTQLGYLLVVIAGVALVISLTVLILVTRRWLNPLKKVVEVADSISAGSFNKRLEVKSNDEIGELSIRFNEMSEMLEHLVDEIQGLLFEMSKGNFRLQVSGNNLYVGDLQTIKNSFEKIIRDISNTMKNVKDASVQVATDSASLSSSSQSLAQGASEQATSIEALSSTISELSKKVDENAITAKEVNQFGQKTGEVINDSSLKMNELLQAITEIKTSSTHIDKIIKTIEDIAFQTNILALNAAVEAARAGQAGRGFAIVADEVRNLAQKSSEAASNTTILIKKSLDSIQKGTRLAESTGQAFGEVEINANKIITSVEKIAISSEDQANRIKELLQVIEQIGIIVQSNSATTEEGASANQELSAQAELLSHLVSKFDV